MHGVVLNNFVVRRKQSTTAGIASAGEGPTFRQTGVTNTEN